ncbi:MAG: pseudouridine synthase [Saprospiraceae bacterium]
MASERPHKGKFKRSQARNAAPPPGIERQPEDDDGMRLNKYVAHSGICSRRQAGEYVKDGLVTVNGEVEKNPAYQVQQGDVITFRGKIIAPASQFVYILLNKPKGVITTLSDEKGRKTVMDLLGDNLPARVFPVGRLDRDTTGLLLLTNDGDLAKKLTHPSHRVPKVYHATLDKGLSKVDLQKIEEGITLEDGIVKVNWINFPNPEKKKEVAVEIHIGRNRIVRRIFEHLGYEVTHLDRNYLAGLTKKDLPRGYFRYLNEKEIIMLKHFVK